MIKVGKPFEPSTIVGHKELKMTEVKISCGGGMGGSCWDVYTQDDFDLNNKFISINTNRSRDTVINTNFVVQTKPVKVLKLTIKNNGNYAMEHKVGETKDYYYLFSADEKIELEDKYIYDDKLHSISFHK